MPPTTPNAGRSGPRFGPSLRLVALMIGLGLLLSALALYWLGSTGTPLSLHLVVALSVMIVAVMGLSGGLMALLFHSSRKGIDDDAGRSD